MEHQIKSVDGGKIQIAITLTPEEKAKFELRALKQAGVRLNIKGFRPGYVPDEIVRQQLSKDEFEQGIIEQAIKEFYPKLVESLNLEVIGQPSLVLQSAEPFVIRVTVAKLPGVDLGKWEKIKIIRQSVVVADSEVEKLISDIRNSRASEAAVTRPAQLGDRAVIDFEITVDRVVVAGGKQTNYQVILGQGHLIPGFEDNIVGIEPGQERDFTINFPVSYHPNLASRTAQVKLKLNQLFARTLSDLTDEFARGLGNFDSVSDLKSKLKQNLYDEYIIREEQRVEREMFEEMLKQAKFDELPEVLINQEIEEMLHELSHSVELQKLDWTTYLHHIKKSEADLRSEFRPQAEKRVKLALLTRAVAKDYKIEVDAETIEKELALLLEHYAHDSRAIDYIQSEDYKVRLKSLLTNRRAVEWLKERLVKPE